MESFVGVCYLPESSMWLITEVGTLVPSVLLWESWGSGEGGKPELTPHTGGKVRNRTGTCRKSVAAQDVVEEPESQAAGSGSRAGGVLGPAPSAPFAASSCVCLLNTQCRGAWRLRRFSIPLGLRS